MYKAFYGFQDKPFSQTPDLKYYYPGSSQKEALRFLSSAIKLDNSNHIVLTGGIGSGKTMLLRGFVKNLGKNYSVIHVCYPAAAGSQLLQMILQSAGIESNQEDSELLRKELTEHLITMHKKRKRTVLVVDEAQNIGDDALKEACRLSELKTGKNYLVKIVFSGLPGMMKKNNALQQAGLPGKTEIIHLNNLSIEEVSEYIKHRLATGGHADVTVFPEDMIMEIGRLSGGAPRIINMICDALLTHGFLAHEKIISQVTLKEVISKLFYLDSADRIQPEQSLAPSDSKITVKGIAGGSVTADGNKQGNSLNAAAETSVHREKVKVVQDKIPLPEHRLPLTILIVEKNARMKVHLENEFRKQGCNFLAFQRLEELLEVLDSPMEFQLPIIVADASFFFNMTGDEDLKGKGILDSIQARYAYIPVIMTSTLPLTAIRTKLFQRGIPFLMKKPDLTDIDMSEVRSQLDLFFNTLQNSIANIHYQLGQFYNMVIKWNPKNTEE
jgi:type II secretory pathway predicted ATPase ExeA